MIFHGRFRFRLFCMQTGRFRYRLFFHANCPIPIFFHANWPIPITIIFSRKLPDTDFFSHKQIDSDTDNFFTQTDRFRYRLFFYAHFPIMIQIFFTQTTRFRYPFYFHANCPNTIPIFLTARFRWPFFLSNKQERMKAYIKKYVYLAFKRPNWLLALENNNCNHLKLKTVTVHSIQT